MADPAPTRILIVDDDPAFLDLLRAHLRSFGIPFDEARDGAEAVAKLRQQPFALVISDMKMPNLDGMGVLKEVREHYPDTGVIITTGYGDSYTYSDVIHAGAIDFLAKPFFRDELEAKINRAMREQALFRELTRLVKQLERQLAEKDASIEELRTQLQETAEKVRQLQARTIMSTYGPHRKR